MVFRSLVNLNLNLKLTSLSLTAIISYTTKDPLLCGGPVMADNAGQTQEPGSGAAGKEGGESVSTPAARRRVDIFSILH